MPATDALAPPLNAAEKAIVKSYGSWTAFMQSYGLKAHDMDDIAEAKSILEGLAASDEA